MQFCIAHLMMYLILQFEHSNHWYGDFENGHLLRNIGEIVGKLKDLKHFGAWMTIVDLL